MQTPTKWQRLRWQAADVIFYIPVHIMLVVSAICMSALFLVYDRVEFVVKKVFK